ncbi:MAG TPA: sugar phosphate isomerase/epimerase family protein [Planctomycetaceae bacterium]|jgi:hexulose-6-phosphate isomerase|nr:sugar phosphate isomerase/epimerase family protein [Planctomycetaceae bacterium]
MSADSVSRRDFLAASAAAVSAVSLAPALASAASDAKTTPRLHKALKFSMVRRTGSLSDTFKMVKECGFEGIDIDRHLEPDEVTQAKTESGLVVHGVVGYEHWHKPLSDPSPAVRQAGRESFIGTLRDCKAYGGTTALLVPGRVTKQVFYADAYKRSQDEVRKLVPVAEELGIVICIENVWNDMLITPLEMARYIDEINSPWVGSYYDVGNSVRFGWPEHWIAVLGKRIKKIDIKEFSRKLMNTKGPGAGFNLKIGEPGGDCDWPSVLAALDAIGYHGWASAEVPGGGVDELKDISQRMDRIFASRDVAAG